MSLRFEGKRALVTGGGRGLGRDIAKALAREGAKTFVLTKSSSSVTSLQREDLDIEVIQVDITDWDNVRSVVKTILPVNVLVNNAGSSEYRMPFLENTESDIDSTFNLNFKPVYNISQVVSEDLINRKQRGAIVNMSSVTGTRQFQGLSIYGSSKAAVDSLTKYMAKELGSGHIRVYSVSPTLIPTDLTSTIMGNPELKAQVIGSIPLRRHGEKHEVTDVVLFLLSDEAGLANGVNLCIDGGQTL